MLLKKDKENRRIKFFGKGNMNCKFDSKEKKFLTLSILDIDKGKLNHVKTPTRIKACVMMSL